MNIDKIIHDKFITLLDKETINNISLLNHDLYGTLIDDNDTFDFFSVADKVRDNEDNISDDSEFQAVYKITSQEILSSILGNELYSTIY